MRQLILADYPKYRRQETTIHHSTKTYQFCAPPARILQKKKTRLLYFSTEMTITTMKNDTRIASLPAVAITATTKNRENDERQKTVHDFISQQRKGAYFFQAASTVQLALPQSRHACTISSSNVHWLAEETSQMTCRDPITWIVPLVPQRSPFGNGTATSVHGYR